MLFAQGCSGSGASRSVPSVATGASAAIRAIGVNQDETANSAPTRRAGDLAAPPPPPKFVVLYQFARRLSLGTYMAGAYNPHTYGYDLAISESASHFITFVPSAGYLKNGPETDYPTPRGMHPGVIVPCTIRGGEFCFAEPGAIGVLKRDGSIEEIRTPTPGAFIGGITTGFWSDDVWFTEPDEGKIGRVTTRFGIYEYPTGIPGSRITGLDLTYGVDNVGIVNGFTFTDPGTNSVGGFAPPTRGLGAPQLFEMPVPTPKSAPAVIGGLFFGESKVARLGFLGATAGFFGGPVIDFASDGVITSLTQSGNAEWATTRKDTLEEIDVPEPAATPGSVTTTSVPGFDNLRDLIWTGNAGGGRGVVIFLAGDPSGTAVVELI